MGWNMQVYDVKDNQFRCEKCKQEIDMMVVLEEDGLYCLECSNLSTEEKSVFNSIKEFKKELRDIFRPRMVNQCDYFSV